MNNNIYLLISILILLTGNEITAQKGAKRLKSSSTEGAITLCDNPSIELALDLSDDLNRIYPSHSSDLIDVNGVVYYTFDDGVHGLELWRSDGTVAGTELVIDFLPGIMSSSIRNLTLFNGQVFFVGTNGNSGHELYSFVPGAVVTPVLVKDIYIGASSSYPYILQHTDSYIYFTARDPVNGIELWRTDGTTVGTTMLGDNNPGPSDFKIQEMAVFGNILVFDATTEDNGYEPWAVDETVGTPYMLADIRIGTGGSNPGDFIVTANQIYFSALLTSKTEVYRTDGTATGTVKLTSFNNSLFLYSLSAESVDGDDLYFKVWESGTNRWRIYKSNGTVAGTSELISDLVSNISSSNIFAIPGKVLFGVGASLWESDGTPEGTSIVKTIFGNGRVGDIVDVNGTYYFAKDEEIWTTDGTKAGTVEVVDLNSQLSGVIYNMFLFDDKMIFYGRTDLEGTELWMSDGTRAGTQVIQDLNPGPTGVGISNRVISNGDLFFLNAIADIELYKVDPSANATMMGDNSSLGPYTESTNAFGSLLAWNDDIAFVYDDSLWIFKPGIGPARKLQLNTPFSYIYNMIQWKSSMILQTNNHLIITGKSDFSDLVLHDFNNYKINRIHRTNDFIYLVMENNNTSIHEIWSINEVGEFSKLTDHTSINDNVEFSPSMTFIDTSAYFIAEHATLGWQIWQSDGTLANTIPIHGIDMISGDGYILSNIGSQILYSEIPTLDAVSLWVLDLKSTSHSKIIDVHPGVEISDFNSLTAFDDKVLFSFTNYDGEYETWISDGTTANTSLLFIGGSIRDVIPLDNYLLMISHNESNYWITDGTQANTMSISSSLVSDDPHSSFNGKYPFYKSQQGLGKEPHLMNASSEQLLRDIRPGVSGSSKSPVGFASVGDGLYFYADNGVNGFELYKASCRCSTGEDMLIDYENIEAGNYRSAQEIILSGATRKYENYNLTAESGIEVNGEFVIPHNSELQVDITTCID